MVLTNMYNPAAELILLITSKNSLKQLPGICFLVFLQRFCIDCFMHVSKRKQLKYLERKYKDLSKQYFYELTEGHNLSKIRDMSYVLNTIKKEISMLQTDLQRDSRILENIFGN